MNECQDAMPNLLKMVVTLKLKNIDTFYVIASVSRI